MSTLRVLLIISLFSFSSLHPQSGFFELISPNGARNVLLTTVNLKDSRAFAFPDSLPHFMEQAKTVHLWVSLDSIQWRQEYNKLINRIFPTYNISPFDLQAAYPEAFLRKGGVVERKRRREASEVPDVALGMLARAKSNNVKSLFSVDHFGRFVGEWSKQTELLPDSFPTRESLLDAFENEEWDSLFSYAHNLPGKLSSGTLQTARNYFWNYLKREASRGGNLFLVPWILLTDQDGLHLSQKLEKEGYRIRPIQKGTGEKVFSLLQNEEVADTETSLELGNGVLRMRVPGTVLQLGNTSGKERMFANNPFRKESLLITVSYLNTPLTSKEIKERIVSFNQSIEKDESVRNRISNNHQEIKPAYALRYFKLGDAKSGEKMWLLFVVHPTMIATVTLSTNQDTEDFDSRFLKAIATLEISKRAESKGLEILKSDTLGFELLAPYGSRPQQTFVSAANNDLNMDFTSYSLSFADISKAYSANFTVYTYETGRFFLSDSSTLASRMWPLMLNRIFGKEKLKSYSVEPLPDESGWVANLHTENKQDATLVRAAFRNQRWYLLIVDFNAKKKQSRAEAETIIASLKFPPTPEIKLKPFTNYVASFSLNVSGALSQIRTFQPEDKNMPYSFADSAKTFMFRDTISGTYCEKRVIYFSPHSRIRNQDTLLHRWIYSYWEQGKDSITDVTPDIRAGISGFRYRLRTKDAFHSRAPGVSWYGWAGLNGSELVHLLLVGRSPELAERFFSGFEPTKNRQNLSETSWTEFVKAINSTDIDVRSSAARAISSFDIDSLDVPAEIKEILLTDWSDDSLGIRSSRAKFLDRIFAGSPDWVFDFMNGLVRQKGLDKNLAFNILLEALITDSADFIAAVPRWAMNIVEAPDTVTGFSWLPYNFRKKEKLAFMGESLFLPLGLSQRAALPWAYWLRLSMEHGTITKEQIIANTPRLLAHAAMLEKEADLYLERHIHEEILELVRLLKHSPDGWTFIYDCLNHKWEDVRIAAHVALACADSSYDKSYILELANEPIYLGDIYRQVSESDCISLLPPALLKPQKLGRALLYDRFKGEETPTRIEFFDKVKTYDTLGVAELLIYRIGYSQKNQMNWYFAAIGPIRENQPFPMKTKNVHCRFAPWYSRSIFQHLNHLNLTHAENLETIAQ